MIRTQNNSHYYKLNSPALVQKPKSRETTKQNKKEKGKLKENKLKIERRDRKMLIKERQMSL